MVYVGLVIALGLIVAGTARLLARLAVASFDWGELVVQVVIAGLAVGFVQAAGTTIDRRFQGMVDDLIGGKVDATALKRPRLHGFGLLIATLLPLLVYLMLLALCASVAAGAAASWMTSHLNRVLLALPIGIIIVVAGAVLGTLYCLYHLLFPAGARAGGGLLLHDRHARLWQLNRDIAAALGTRPVDEIMVDIEPNIGVFQEGGFLPALLGRGRRILVVGLPALYNLEVREFAAILTHEYGHLSQGDTRWIHFTAYVSRALTAALEAMPGPHHGFDGVLNIMMALNPGYWVLSLYARVFFRTTGSFARFAEVKADLKAIQLYGGATCRSALMKVTMSGPVFAEAVGRYYLPQLNTGAPPVKDPAVLMQTVYTRAAPAELKRMEKALLDPENASPYDTHPPLPVRLDLAARAGEAANGSTEPVSALFDEWETINAHVMDGLNRVLLRRGGDE